MVCIKVFLDDKQASFVQSLVAITNQAQDNDSDDDSDHSVHRVDSGACKEYESPTSYPPNAPSMSRERSESHESTNESHESSDESHESTDEAFKPHEGPKAPKPLRVFDWDSDGTEFRLTHLELDELSHGSIAGHEWQAGDIESDVERVEKEPHKFKEERIAKAVAWVAEGQRMLSEANALVPEGRIPRRRRATTKKAMKKIRIELELVVTGGLRFIQFMFFIY